MKEHSQGEEGTDEIGSENGENVVESGPVILFIGIFLRFHVPVFSIKIREECTYSDEKRHLWPPEENKRHCDSEEEMSW